MKFRIIGCIVVTVILVGLLSLGSCGGSSENVEYIEEVQ
jgi:hypothetical protein